MNPHPLLRRWSGSKVLAFVTALACAVGANLTPLHAAELPPPSTFLVSGKLRQANVLAQGQHDFRFQLYTSETGGQIPNGSREILVTRPVTDGKWEVAVDLRRFATEGAVLGSTPQAGSDLIRPPEGYLGILDDIVRPPQGWLGSVVDVSRPPMGARSLSDNTVHTATALNWRAAQGTWLQISVRRTGGGAFVPLSPRQRLTAVPGAVVAQTAHHALVAGTVSESGVDARALAPGAITAEKISVGAINGAALANLAVTSSKIAPLTVVRSLNGLQDDVTLAAGTGVSLSAAGGTITINSTSAGGGTPLPNGNFIGANNDNQFGGSASFSVIGGGQSSKISDENSYSTLGGGQLNRIYERSSWSFLGGGYNHQVGPNAAYASLGGGYSHILTNANSATIAGGSQNVAGGDLATIGGGGANFAGAGGTVAGGGGNRAEGAGDTVGGGFGNLARAAQATVGGGNNNVVETSTYGTVAGGTANRLTNSIGASIGGGEQNGIIDARDSAIGGGLNNLAGTAYSSIIGGEGNRTEGIGGYATVLGGSFNLASGTHSVAAGHRARAIHSASFIWNAWPGDVFASERDGEFAAKAYGGFRFVTGGVDVGAGDITLDAGNAAVRASGKSATFSFGQAFNLTAGGGVNLTTGGQGLFVDGQRLSASGGGGGGNGPINVITGGGQTEPQARIEQTNPDDYVRLMLNTPRSFWTIGTGPDGAFGFYVPGQSPANTTGDKGAHRFLITANGEVGVGSQQPFAQFHVRGRGGFDKPQARLTQENPQDFARLRLETGQQAWDIAAGPDGSLRFFGAGADRMVLGATGLTVNGRAVAYADQLGQGGGQPGNGGVVTATVAQGTAVTAIAQDPQAGVGLEAQARVGVRAISTVPQGTAVQAIQTSSAGYAGDFVGKVKVSSTLEANGGIKVGGRIQAAGIGDNTPTAAFRLVPEQLVVFSVANPGSITSSFAILDHPHLNGSPNALLLLTPVNADAFKLYQRSTDVLRGDFLRYYPDTPDSPVALRGRWTIDITRTPPPFGQPQTGALAVFNALVVTP
jgi:hypothetical protein